MAKKDRLKNGLDLLFEDNFHDEPESAEESGGVKTLRISLVEPDKNQPRTDFDPEKLQELADNIMRHGVLQPILVRPLSNGSYKIVAGERRWRASRMAGLSEIPVVIRELSDHDAAQIALIENLQREDLNPIEEARAFCRLMTDFEMTQEMVGEAVGKSRAAVANSQRLLKLEDEVQKLVAQKKISVGHAKVLCGLSGEKQLEFARKCVGDELTVRQLESEISRSEKVKPKSEPKTDFGDPFGKFSVETQMSFKQLYGIDTKLGKEKNGGFSMKFTFKNEAELKEMIARLAEKLDKNQ